MPDAGSSTMAWHELHMASDGQRGIGRDEVGTVSRAPPWKASIPSKVPGLCKQWGATEGFNWD